uniref:Uncharacterized protein n=1 Tax=Globodera rostochiensis TaxID=31243 RepID=A0A914IDT9_GLORO
MDPDNGWYDAKKDTMILTLMLFVCFDKFSNEGHCTQIKILDDCNGFIKSRPNEAVCATIGLHVNHTIKLVRELYGLNMHLGILHHGKLHSCRHLVKQGINQIWRGMLEEGKEMPLQLKASLLAVFAFSAVSLTVRARRGAMFWRCVAVALCNFLTTDANDFQKIVRKETTIENGGDGGGGWIIWTVIGFLCLFPVIVGLWWWHRKRVSPPATAPATALAKAMATAIALATVIATATVADGSPPFPARDEMIKELKVAQVARHKRLQIIY